MSNAFVHSVEVHAKITWCEFDQHVKLVNVIANRRVSSTATIMQNGQELWVSKFATPLSLLWSIPNKWEAV